MTHVFALPALEDAVRAGDYDAVVEVLRRMTPEQRRSERTGIARVAKVRRQRPAERGEGWEWLQREGQSRVLLAVALICGSARDAMAFFYSFAMREVIELGTEFRPPILPQFAEEILKENRGNIHDIQKLIAAGLIPRPDSDEYTAALLGLFRGPLWQKDMRAKIETALHEPFEADPGLGDALLRILDTEGSAGWTLASFEQHSDPDRRWSNILLLLIERGMYSRALMLEKTLTALERGVSPSHAGWFQGFHEKLAPTIGEMTPHASRYVALLGSRIPLTVTFALSVARQLEDAHLVAPEQLVEALRPVFASPVKRQVDAAFKFLDRAVKRVPALASTAARMILPALVHESADMQKQVLTRLRSWGVDEPTREALAQYAGTVAAVHRDELQRLAGTQPPPPVAKSASPGIKSASPGIEASPPPGSQPSPPATAQPLPASGPFSAQGTDLLPPSRPAIEGFPSPLAPTRRIPPIASLDELIERVAYVFENSLDLGEVERVLGALAQFAPLSDDARARFAPVAKRLPKLRTPTAFEVGRVLHFLLTGERIAATPGLDTWGPNLADQHLIERVDAIMDLAAQGRGVIPLSTPTHLRGFIDPTVLVERVRTHLAANATTSLHQQASALLRLAPDTGGGALDAARDLPLTELTLALRYALGGQVQRPTDSILFAAAERVRRAHGGSRRWEWFLRPVEEGSKYFRLDFRSADSPSEPTPDPVTAIERASEARDRRGWFDRPTVAGRRFEGFVVYYSTLVPSDLDAFLSDGATEIARNIDWQQTFWQNAAYLRVLLDPTVAMSPIATVLLALGLAGKEAGQTAIAVDALVQAHVQGRLNPTLLAGTVRDLLRHNLVANARYAKNLRAALRIDATISGVIFQVLCTSLEANPADPPKDTGAIMELMQEIAIGEGRKLSAHERGTLEQLALGGKASSLRTSLLKRA